MSILDKCVLTTDHCSGEISMNNGRSNIRFVVPWKIVLIEGTTVALSSNKLFLESTVGRSLTNSCSLKQQVVVPVIFGQLVVPSKNNLFFAGRIIVPSSRGKTENDLFFAPFNPWSENWKGRNLHIFQRCSTL